MYVCSFFEIWFELIIPLWNIRKLFRSFIKHNRMYFLTYFIKNLLYFTLYNIPYKKNRKLRCNRSSSK